MESIEEFVEAWKNWKLINAVVYGTDSMKKSRRTIILVNGYEFVTDFFLHPSEGTTRIQFFEQIENVEELCSKGIYEVLEIARIE
jgi:hypothetical protein